MATSISLQPTVRSELPTWAYTPPMVRLRAWLQRPIFAALDRVAPATVAGLEALDGLAGPVIFAANHTSHLDSPVLLRALPAVWRRQVAVAAAADYFAAHPR